MKHVILIGFKSVGKSLVGENLAVALDRPFIDSDIVLENLYAEGREARLSCREIMRVEGEEFFRALEHEALKKVLAETAQTIVAVGGGAPLQEKNAELFKSHQTVHLTAPKSVVYERIIVNGWPAFFPREVDPYVSFQKIWEERLPSYERLATITIENNAPVDDTVNKLIISLNSESV
ncbi:MAG: shikimate kinase [Patescibacteria group bacterium]|mgnify:CR=1 FL=1